MKSDKMEPFFARCCKIGAHHVNRKGEMKRYLKMNPEAPTYVPNLLLALSPVLDRE
jgi:hypothetical protein